MCYFFSLCAFFVQFNCVCVRSPLTPRLICACSFSSHRSFKLFLFALQRRQRSDVFFPILEHNQLISIQEICIKTKCNATQNVSLHNINEEHCSHFYAVAPILKPRIPCAFICFSASCIAFHFQFVDTQARCSFDCVIVLCEKKKTKKINERKEKSLHFIGFSCQHINTLTHTNMLICKYANTQCVTAR